MSKIHKIDVHTIYYKAIFRGELQSILEDHTTQSAGDLLHIHEFDARLQRRTGRELTATISYVLTDPKYINDGYCVLSIRQVERVVGSANR